jgi:predicted MFS family arabinose efflux permease
MLIKFLAAVALMGVAGGLYETTFNNYLSDVFSIGAGRRGAIEFPREMPGFLVTLTAGAFAAIALNRASAAGMLLYAAGLLGVAAVGGRFSGMMLFLVVWSTGAHLLMPVQESITLSLAREGRQATRLGQVGVAGILGTVAGATGVRLLNPRLGSEFRTVYILAACFAVAASAMVYSMGRVEKEGQARRRVFVFKRRYSVFYVLCALFGARKQIFMTFGPWVIVRIFQQPSGTIATLWIAYSVIGVFMRPLIGHLIDRVGEKKALFVEGMLLTVICVTYSIAGHYEKSPAALWAVMVVYVLDQMSFAISMARTTYLSKIAESREDIPGGLAAGVSIDHAASMTLPLLGGFVWEMYGCHWVFWGAAVVALSSSAVSLLVRVGTAEGAAATAQSPAAGE